MDRNFNGQFCFTCCDCPSPLFSYVQRSVSKGKVGMTEYINPSTPPKYYLQQYWGSSGGGGCDGGGPCNGTLTTQGQAIVNHLTGACVGYNSRNGGGAGSSDYSVGCGGFFFDAYCYGGCTVFTISSGVTDSGANYTQTTFSETWSCASCSATAWANLSEEYTTAQLIADALTLLPAWGAMSAFGGGYPSEIASTELNANETGYSIMDGKYQLAHRLPSGGTYKLAWVERFTPDGGGAPVDTPQQYAWDGSRPSNYDPSDPKTWPHSEVFEVDHPTTNGTVSLHNMTLDCGVGPKPLFS